MKNIRLYNLTPASSYKLETNMESKKFTLNKEDGLKILKGAGIALAGALLTYLADLIPSIDFGSYTPVVVSLSSILINAGLKFIRGK